MDEQVRCAECGKTLPDSETDRHMLWKHPSPQEVKEVLDALDVAGSYIVDLLAEGRSTEAIMALLELEQICARARGYLEAEFE